MNEKAGRNVIYIICIVPPHRWDYATEMVRLPATSDSLMYRL